MGTNFFVVSFSAICTEFVHFSHLIFILRIIYEHPNQKTLITLYLSPQNKKSAPTEVNALKTQTPIVAKQNQINGNDKSSHTICGICSFAKFKTVYE
jgi:hypothetical protein